MPEATKMQISKDSPVYLPPEALVSGCQFLHSVVTMWAQLLESVTVTEEDLRRAVSLLKGSSQTVCRCLLGSLIPESDTEVYSKHPCENRPAQPSHDVAPRFTINPR